MGPVALMHNLVDFLNEKCLEETFIHVPYCNLETTPIDKTQALKSSIHTSIDFFSFHSRITSGNTALISKENYTTEGHA